MKTPKPCDARPSLAASILRLPSWQAGSGLAQTTNHTRARTRTHTHTHAPRSTGLTTGREATAPLPGGAVSFHKVEAWDGKDAPVVEEEEVSLEDILGEEL